MDDILVQKFKENNHFYEADTTQFRYYQFWGSDEFRKRLATLLTTFFKPQALISYEDVSVTETKFHSYLLSAQMHFLYLLHDK